MQERRHGWQSAFLVSMTALALAFGCGDDDGLAPKGEGGSGRGTAMAAAGKGSAVVSAGSGGSAGPASPGGGEASDGGMTSAVSGAGGGAGEAASGEGGQGGQAGEASALAGCGGEGGSARLQDHGGSSSSDGGSRNGGIAGTGGAGIAGIGNTSGTAGSGGTASVGTLPCDVRAALKARCQTCHAEPPIGLAPMSLLTWSAVNMYADAIQEKLDGDLMPPPGAPGLSPNQLNTLLVYVSLGAPSAGNVTCP